MTTAESAPEGVAELSLRFARLLGDPPDRPPRLGVEQEYAVLEAGRQLDFGPIVDRVGFEGLQLHPTNERAYQTPSGLLLMADGRVAEAATPPVPFVGGFVDALEQSAAAGRAALDASLDDGQKLVGGSTHLSVEVDPELNDELCAIYTQTFAPALMLLIDRADSPGVLIRPRPSRAELCGEFVEGARLRAAIAFAAGSVAAVQAVLRGDDDALPLPMSLEVAATPGRQRHGWYVDRKALGPDLYEQGRGAELPLQSGGSVSAQDHLAACWEIARATLVRMTTDPADFEAADDVVAGRLPLPSERAGLHDAAAGSANAVSPAYERMLAPAQRPDLTVSPVSGTWDYTAFEIRGVSGSDDRAAVVTVPADQIEGFLDRLARGLLDDVLRSYLQQAPANRVLESSAQTTRPGLFDSVSASSALLPADRVGVGSGAVSEQRPGKLADEPPTQTGWMGSHTLSSLPWGWIGGGIVGVLLLGLFALGGGGGSGDSGPWSVTDPRNDFVPTFSDKDGIANPSAAGDVTRLDVAVADGNTTVTVTFAGAAEGLMTEGGEELAAALQFIPVGDERWIDILFNEDGSVKISDPPSGSRITATWSSPNVLVFEILGVTPASGATVRFATIQRDGFAHSTDEVSLATGGADAVVATAFVTDDSGGSGGVPEAPVIVGVCGVISVEVVSAALGPAVQTSAGGDGRQVSRCRYEVAGTDTNLSLLVRRQSNPRAQLFRTFRDGHDQAGEIRSIDWGVEGELRVTEDVEWSAAALLVYVHSSDPVGREIYVRIDATGAPGQGAALAAAIEPMAELLRNAILEAQP